MSVSVEASLITNTAPGLTLPGYYYYYFLLLLLLMLLVVVVVVSNVLEFCILQIKELNHQNK